MQLRTRTPSDTINTSLWSASHYRKHMLVQELREVIWELRQVSASQHARWVCYRRLYIEGEGTSLFCYKEKLDMKIQLKSKFLHRHATGCSGKQPLACTECEYFRKKQVAFAHEASVCFIYFVLLNMDLVSGIKDWSMMIILSSAAWVRWDLLSVGFLGHQTTEEPSSQPTIKYMFPELVTIAALESLYISGGFFCCCLHCSICFTWINS